MEIRVGQKYKRTIPNKGIVEITVENVWWDEIGYIVLESPFPEDRGNYFKRPHLSFIRDYSLCKDNKIIIIPYKGN